MTASGSAVLREHREAWLARAVDAMRRDPRVLAAAFWGSLARGESDDWSDVDLIAVVSERDLDSVVADLRADHSRFGDVAVVVDMPQNGLDGGGYLGVTYVDSGLPVHVDWYLCSLPDAVAWPDTAPLFDRASLATSTETFADALVSRRSAQSRSPGPPAMTLSMLPIAVKYVVRGSPDLRTVIELAGIRPVGGLSGHAAIAALRAVLVDTLHEGGTQRRRAFEALLDLADEHLRGTSA